MITDEKLEKFLLRMESFVKELRSYDKLEVHTHINQFYYLQKMEELKLQRENLAGAVKRLEFVQENIENNYKEIFCRWSQEVRWLGRNLPRSRRPVH